MQAAAQSIQKLHRLLLGGARLLRGGTPCGTTHIPEDGWGGAAWLHSLALETAAESGGVSMETPREAAPACRPPCLWPVLTGAPPGLFYRPVVRDVTF